MGIPGFFVPAIHRLCHLPQMQRSFDANYKVI